MPLIPRTATYRPKNRRQKRVSHLDAQVPEDGARTILEVAAPVQGSFWACPASCKRRGSDLRVRPDKRSRVRAPVMIISRLSPLVGGLTARRAGDLQTSSRPDGLLGEGVERLDSSQFKILHVAGDHGHAVHPRCGRNERVDHRDGLRVLLTAPGDSD